MMQPHMAVAQNHSEAEWRGEEEGAGGAKKTHPVPVTVHPRKGVSARPKPWQHFTLLRDLSLPSAQPVRRVKVKCWALTQRHFLEGGGGGAGRQVTECREKTNKATRLPIHPPRGFDEKRRSEISGHISFEQARVKVVITAKAEGGEVGFKSHPSLILLLILASWSSKAAPPPPTDSPWVPCSCALHTSADAGGSFQGRVVMESSPSDVCSSKAAGRVGQAAEPAKASPLQTG